MAEARDDEDLAKLPLDAWHRAHGARMVPFAGYAMPVQYAGIVAEHEWTRVHASLFDVSHMGQLFVSGDGAEAALEALLPIDLATLELGALRYSLLLDDEGGILDDLIVARWRQGFLVVVNGATKHADIAHMRDRLPAGVALEHRQDEALLALQGPEAFAVLERHATGQWPLSALTFMRGGPFAVGGVDAWISRTGYTGEDGFEISLPAAQAERIAEILAAGPARRRVGLSLEGRLPAREGAVVFAGEAEAGRVTSGGFSPTLGHPIAMAYVDADRAAPGTTLAIEVRGRRLDAKVVPLPFVPHRYHRQGAGK